MSEQQGVNSTAASVDPGDQYGPRLNLVLWILVSLSLIFLILRVYCKCSTLRRLWWDDYLLIAAWVFVLSNTILVTVAITLGFGSHITAVPHQNLPTLGLLSKFDSTLSILAAVSSKVSFAVTLLRLTDGRTRTFVWFTIISMSCTMALSILLFWLQCIPLGKQWNPSLPGSCLPKDAKIGYDIFSGAYSGIMDITLAMLPWKLVWGLQMKKREKFGVAVAMSMGIFAGATAFIKCIELRTLASSDYTYKLSELAIWGTAESTTTIMAASIPVMRVLIKEVGRRVRGSGSVEQPKPHDKAIFERRITLHQLESQPLTSKGTPWVAPWE